MLKVIVEVHPWGAADAAYSVLEIDIWNDGRNETEGYNYGYRMGGRVWQGVKPQAEGYISGYDRTRPVADLVAAVLEDAKSNGNLRA